jgi:hypothetical protein
MLLSALQTIPTLLMEMGCQGQWYSQPYGQTFLKCLAISAALEAERHKEVE